MSTKRINLSSSGLKNITLNMFAEKENFSLKFGDQEIQMNKIFAEFISPVVSRLTQSDPTIQSVDFNDLFSSKSNDFSIFAKDILSSDIISLLREISSGVLIEIDDNQAYKLRLLSIILGNDELYSKINELFPSDFSAKNLSQYINLIQCYYYFSQFSFFYNFSDLIDFISQNFYLIEEDTFLKIPRNLQYLIISNPHLQLKSEDSLLDLILQIIDNDKNSSEKVSKNDEKIEDISFLEQIEFAGLTEEKLREFLRIFDSNTFNFHKENVYF